MGMGFQPKRSCPFCGEILVAAPADATPGVTAWARPCTRIGYWHYSEKPPESHERELSRWICPGRKCDVVVTEVGTTD